MVLLETARILHPSLYQDLKNATWNGDQFGISGTTAYSCENYTSPLHGDNDSARGLCAQFFLQAIKYLKEYAFIYADYGIYFITQSNCLWYVKTLD